MIVAKWLYTSACQWFQGQPAKPPLSSNEEIQRQLEELDRPGGGPSEEVPFWDDFAQGSFRDRHENAHHPKIELFNQAGQAVDLGCGIGLETKYLLLKNWKVEAVDVSAKALELLKSQAGSSENLKVVESSLEEFEFTCAPDLILAINVLGFCTPSKLKTIWERMHAALKPGGYVFCSLPLPGCGNFSKWVLSDDEITQFLLEGRFEKISDSISLDPYGDHPLVLILKKI